MTAKELKRKYFDFFLKRGHRELPNLSLIPENDPTALFISAGMHPLVPYLLGEPHPLGKRLVGNQRCLRTDDIDNVGDCHHLTFFEMLGNWSLGDYWKEEAIFWSWEFLTKELALPKKRIHVSCFKGDQEVPRDEESARIWKKLGVSRNHIHFFGRKENWWGPVGQTGPCGPDTEMFLDMGGKCRLGKEDCDPSCQCGKYFEIWNDVFMEYNKTPEEKYEPLKQRNVDTGMGVERTIAVLQGKNDSYQTELFAGLINQIEKISGQRYQGKNKKPMRIIADHFRAATFIIADGVIPANIEQGYVLRRLIRRAIRFGRPLQLIEPFAKKIARTVINIYKEEYPHLEKNRKQIFQELESEEGRFRKTLERGLKEIEKYKILDGKIAFYLYETYGIPLEMTQEIAQERGQKIEKEVFEREFKKHQKLSKKGAEKKFAGGLADHSREVTKLHTATHLLHQALRDVLGQFVRQVGSNITSARLRFDFTHPKQLTEEEIQRIERIVNQKIKANLPVKMKIMSLEEAKKQGALALFGERYEGEVKVYSIGNYSKEVCGGPHVRSTGEIGGVKIIKEKAIGAGRRRIYAELIKS